MKEDAPKLLFDVLSAVETIEHFITGKSIDDYQSDKMLRSAVERQFLVIGEALVKLRSLDPETAATIPEPRQIIAFRNLVGTTRLKISRSGILRRENCRSSNRMSHDCFTKVNS